MKLNQKKKNRGNSTRQFVSLFGGFEITRRRYSIEEQVNYYPLDEALSLPKKKLSYSLQGLIGKSSAEEDYRQSVGILNELLSLNLTASHVKRVVEDLGPMVDSFYEDQTDYSDIENTDGSFLAFGNDGKGVPIVKREREIINSGEEARLMKGKKRGVKKQATVAVSFSFNPRVRDSEDILRGLFREAPPEGTDKKDEKDRRYSLNVHKRAFMCDQKKGINYAIENLIFRNVKNNKPIIALVDCGTGLEKGILDSIKSHGLEKNLKAIIADVVHVSEYAWKAANAILGEKSKLREGWVRSLMKDILESKTKKVIKDLQANIDKTKLTKSKQDQIQKTITYLTNHEHKMDYKTYLKNGYPISTGLIEGCCGHLIKDRMEGSGMRWTIAGAQNIIDLRSAKKNQDWDSFMEYVVEKNNPHKLKKCA
jgi:hypothetical protein